MSEESSLGEFDVIEQLFARLAAREPGAEGLTNDAAVLAVPEGQELVVTKDMMVEGVHFLPDDPPDLVARKLLRVNLSDLAARGATPWRYMLGLSLGEGVSDNWLRRFADGLMEDQDQKKRNQNIGRHQNKKAPSQIKQLILNQRNRSKSKEAD